MRRISNDHESRGIQSIEIGGRLLQALAAVSQPAMLRDLAAMADIAPAQAHAYLTSYCKLDLVEQDPASSRYRLGPFAMRLGMARMRTDEPLTKAGSAAAELSRTLDTTVAIVIWASGAPTVIEVHEGPHELNINMRHGTIFGVTNTLSGRVFAAFRSDDSIKARIDTEFARAGRLERGVKVTRAAFDRGVVEVRRKGYVGGFDVAVPGAAAVAAPVLGHNRELLLVLTLIDLRSHLDIAEDGVAVRTLLRTTSSLSDELRARSPDQPPVATRARQRQPRGAELTVGRQRAGPTRM
jgi:DNA-binding IclR family transcriptional regulator